MGLRFEAWTLPWAATFERKVADIPAVLGGARGLARFNDYGEASLAVPPGYDRLDEIVSDTTGSLIRVYDGSTIIQEFLADRVEYVESDEVGATISGPDIKSVFDRAVVYPYDYPTSPSLQPDWIFGGTNVLTNPGLEDSSVTPLEYQLVITATGGTYTFTGGSDTTAAIAFNATPATIETRLETDITGITDILVSQQSGVYLITYVQHPYSPTLSINTGSLTGGSATLSATQDGGLSPLPWTVAGSINADLSKSFGYYDAFGVSDVQKRTGSYSLLVNPGKVYATQHRNPGAQQIVSVRPGRVYQASVWIYPTNGTDKYRLGLFGIGEEVIGLDPNGLSGGALTANTWNQLTISDVVMPDNADQVIFRVQCTNGPSNPAAFYIDDAELNEGLDATSCGGIVTALMDDAASDHSADTRGTILDWIDYTGFNATNDSAATAWAQELSFTAYRGMTYGQAFDRLVELGFEWDLTPKATPSGGLTHDLEWYEIGGRDSAPETAVNAGQGTIAGAVVKRIPQYTAVLVEGEGNLWVEDSDTTAVTNFGRLEAYQSGFGLATTGTLGLAGDALLDEESTNRTAVQMQVQAGDGFPRPLVDYKPGDTIWFQSPPALTRTQRRVRTVSWQNTEPPSYQVTGSRVFDTESGAWEAIRKILRRFRPLEEKASGGAVSLGGGGGMATVLVAASNALATEKEKADLVCTGTDDQVVIQEAIDLVATGFGRGTVWLSSGTFNVTVPASGQAINVLTAVELRGLGGSHGEGGTFIQPSNSTDPGSVPVVRLRGSSALRNVTVYAYWSMRAIQIHDYVGLVQIENVYTESDGASLYAIGTNDVWVTNCMFIGSFAAANDTESCIYIGGGSTTWHVTNTSIGGGWHGIHIDDSIGGGPSNSILITGCWIQLSMYAAVFFNSPSRSAAYSTVRDCLILSTGQSATAGTALGAITVRGLRTSDDLALGSDKVTENIPGIQIINNHMHGLSVLHGVMLDGVYGARVQGNLIENATQHGVFLTQANDNQVLDNIIAWPSSTTTTHDGIHLVSGTNGCDRNMIARNGIYEKSAATAVYWRYGINVSDSGCNDNVIVGNDLRGASGGTGPYNNAGTGTINTYPAHATYGDNFT